MELQDSANLLHLPHDTQRKSTHFDEAQNHNSTRHGCKNDVRNKLPSTLATGTAIGCELKPGVERTHLHPQTPEVERETFATQSGTRNIIVGFMVVSDHSSIPEEELQVSFELPSFSHNDHHSPSWTFFVGYCPVSKLPLWSDIIKPCHNQILINYYQLES